MKKILLSISITSILSLSGNAFSQSDGDVTLVFKRPFATLAGDGFYDTKIMVNGVEACTINNDHSKIESCTYKTKAGETKIIVTTSRGTDFENIFDSVKGKTYTLVVYMKNFRLSLSLSLSLKELVVFGMTVTFNGFSTYNL